MKPVVSVSIVSSNYNYADFLADFFQSIQESTILPHEIVMIDDGSTDESVKVLNEYIHLGYFKLILNKENKGFAYSLNEAVKIAQSRYIMRLDTDDFISSDRIEKQFNFLEANPDIDLVGSNVFYYNHQLNKIVFRSNLPEVHDRILKQYKKGFHGLVHSSVMIRSRTFKKYEYVQDNVPAEEYDLFSRMIRNGVKTANLSEPLTYYRLHDRNISQKKMIKSIQKINNLRYNLYNKRRNQLLLYLQSWHLLLYRKALLADNLLERFFYLFASTLLNPTKIFTRIFF